jgi:hypothetical protein
MNPTVFRSRCECQASLTAEVAADGLVLSGQAALRGKSELAPATRTRLDGVRFDIGWQCPFCGRNTLRTFDLSAAS